MGVQFCNSNGGSSSTYPATLNVDWNSLPTKPQDTVVENSQAENNDKTGASNESSSVNIEQDENTSGNAEKNESASPNVESNENTSGNVETMDGLNIYHADEDVNVEELDDKEEIQEESALGESDKNSDLEAVKDKEIDYLAFYNLPVILITGCAAVIVIIIGIVLIIMSKRGEKND